MKQITETKITKSNRSLITTIPSAIVTLENITNTDNIIWSYEIKDNTIRYEVKFTKNENNTSNKK